MAKGDDALLKKRNKAVRKRARRAGAGTAESVQGTQEHRRRRKLGTRRKCEGMCYTLPTPQDPFNDTGSSKKKKRRGNGEDAQRAEGIKATKRKRDEEVEGKGQEKVDEDATSSKRRKVEQMIEGLHNFVETQAGGGGRGKPQRTDLDLVEDGVKKSLLPPGNGHVPSRFAWRANASKPPADADIGNLKGDKAAELAFQISLHGILPSVNSGGIGGKLEKQCWSACGRGVDVLGAFELEPEKRMLCYVPAAAAHIVGRGVTASDKIPVAVILVASQDRVQQVRLAAKALKKLLQISCVGLHTGTGIDRQLEGLQAQTPQMIVATPERLCELVALDALKLTGVSFLVLDGLDDLLARGFESELIRIEATVHSSRQMFVLCKAFPANVVRTARLFMKDPVVRVTSYSSTALRSACITQCVSVVIHDDKKLVKFDKILEEVRTRHLQSRSSPRMLAVLKRRESVPNLFASMLKAGLNVEDLTACKEGQELADLPVVQKFQEGEVHALVLIESMLSRFPLKSINVSNVVFYDFPSSFSAYCIVVTGMSSETIHGRVYSICSGGMAPLAEQLVDLLHQCAQAVPPALEMLVKAASTVLMEKSLQ